MFNGRCTFTDGKSKYAFTSTKNVAKLLPSPYRSECINFDIGTGTDLCEHRCMVEYFYRTRRKLTAFRLVWANDTRRPSWTWHHDERYWLAPECSERCSRAECASDSIQNTRVAFDSRHHSDFDLLVNVGLTRTETVFLPRQTLDEFVVFIFGVVGLWFGYSLLDILELLTEMSQLAQIYQTVRERITWRPSCSCLRRLCGRCRRRCCRRQPLSERQRMELAGPRFAASQVGPAAH